MRPSCSRTHSRTHSCALAAATLALAMPAAASAQSLADFTASIYPPVVPAYPCTKLLNRSGAIGCENPTQQVLAPLELIGSEAELSARADAPAPRTDAPMLVLPYEVFAHDDAFESIDRIAPAGILVLAPNASALPPHFSPDDQDPQHGTGLYADADPYSWNPLGTGIAHRFFRFPIFLVGRSAVAAVVARCEESQAQEQEYPRWSAKAVLTMQAQTNSLQCLADSSCMPITGQSVLSALGRTGGDEVILAASVMDSTSFFHGDWSSREDQLSPGGGAEIAGAVAAIAAARALRTVRDELAVPILFATFSAEMWGRVGSRRLLSHPPANRSRIRYAVGVGGIHSGTDQLYVHADPSHPGQEGAAELQTRLVTAAGPDLTASSIQRLPPNPVETFAKQRADGEDSPPSVVIAGHDAAFGSQYYHSELDGLNNAPVETVCRLARELARSLHVLSTGQGTSSLEADCGLVQELLECTLQDFSCARAKQLLESEGADVDGTPPHYVMIRRNPYGSSPMEAFFFGTMANETASSYSSHVCSENADCKEIGQVEGFEKRLCVGGRCLVSDTSYHDAFSSALAYDPRIGALTLDESKLLPDDPLWTESNWHADLGVTLFLQDDPALERRMLICGIVWALLCFGGVALLGPRLARGIKDD